MKIVLSVLLAIAVVGCILFGVAFVSVQGDLDNTKTQLEATQSELAGAEAELAGAQTELADSREDLAAAENKLANTLYELDETRTELNDTAAQLDAALEYNTAMGDAYASLSAQITRKLGFDEDSELIFTPSDPAVSAKARQIAGNFSSDWDEVWRDYQRLYEWIVDNIRYSYDSPLPILPATPDGELSWMSEYWKLPEETLADEAGDCEDMAGLLASLMLSYNHEDYMVWAIVIRDYEGNGHVGVALPVEGDKLAIFDPAGQYYTGYYTGSIKQVDISDAVDQWLSYWSDDMPAVRITAAFSSDFYEEFSGTPAFISWANSQY